MSEQEKEDRRISILKKASLKFNKSAFNKISCGAIYASLILICLIIAFFAPIALIILFPTVVIPATFALQLSCRNINVDPNFKISKFFKTYALYFSMPFSGAYRVMVSILKALGIWAGISFICLGVLTVTIVMNDPAMLEELNAAIQTAKTFDEFYVNANEIIQGNYLILMAIDITSVVAVGGAMMMFFHATGVSSMRVYLSVLAQGMVPMKEVGRIFNYGFPRVRKQFYKQYYNATWFLTLSMIIAYALGSLVGFYAKFNVNQISIIGVAFCVLVMVFALPFYFDVIDYSFQRLQSHFMQASFELSVKDIEKMKQMQKISEDEIKEFNETIKEAEEAMNDYQKMQDAMDSKPFYYNNPKKKKKDDKDDDDNDEEKKNDLDGQ